MIKLEFDEIRVSASGGAPVMLLSEVGGARYLPVWITASSGSAILSANEHRDEDHPPTHDLVLDLLSVLDSIIERVEITDESEGVFSAQLVVDSVVVPCRVSDGVALALRAGFGIWATKEIMDRCGVLAVPDVEPGTALDTDDEVVLFREFLDSVSAEDFTDES